MKYDNLRAFEKHLEGAAALNFADVYLILAKEPFERKAAVDRVIKGVLKGEPSPDLCLHLFDGERDGAQGVLGELETLTFFVKKRVIVVQNFNECDKATIAKLEAYLATPNRSVCLVLAAPAFNKVTNFYKKAEKLGVVLEVAEEKPWDKEKSIAEWTIRTAGALGKQLDQQTAREMVQQLGTDQTLLSNELQKLVCYVGERRAITRQDLSAVCSHINRDTGWQLGEAIFRRDAAAALRIGKNLLAEGAALIAMLRQVRSQFQTELQICLILEHGGSPADVVREFPFMRGSLLEKYVQQARSYGARRLKQGLLKLDDAELAAKSSSADPDFLLELLLIKLTV